MTHDSATADGAETDERRRRRRRRAPTAAFLSFLVPGAGQFWNRQRRLGAVLVLPFALLILATAVIVVLGRSSILPWLMDVRILIGLVALNVVLFVWRTVAVVQAHWYRANFGFDRVGSYVTGVLILLTIGMHAIPMLYGAKLIDTLTTVALEGYRGSAGDMERFPGFVGPSGEPLPRSSREPRVEVGERVNILLVGLDSAPDRTHALTDTMLVLSLDTDGGSAMISIPRDLVNAPLPNGEPYPQKLNSLLQTANEQTARYPFGGGVATLKATIGELLGVTIDYIAAVDMAGFQQMVDAIGGVEITLDSPVEDPSIGWSLPAGPTVMNGETALRFVRARYGPGDDDFVRAARQQLLLAAIREQFASANLFAALPSFLDAVKNTIATDVPADRIPALAEAIQDADVGRLERAVIEPPLYVTPATGDNGAYVLIPDLARIRELGHELMGG
jgi:LCP family protein required for cell wall assembly